VEFGPLPKTSTGKIQKYVLREREWKGARSDSGAAMLDDIARCDTNTRKQGDEGLGKPLPICRPGTAITAHSITAGYSPTAAQLDGADILAAGNDNIFHAIAQFDCPTGWRTPISPLWNQPPANAFLVAAGQRSNRASPRCLASPPRPALLWVTVGNYDLLWVTVDGVLVWFGSGMVTRSVTCWSAII